MYFSIVCSLLLPIQILLLDFCHTMLQLSTLDFLLLRRTQHVIHISPELTQAARIIPLQPGACEGFL